MPLSLINQQYLFPPFCRNLQYIEADGTEYFHTLKGYPSQLEKKVTLLKYFLSYMNDHLLKVCDERFDSITFPIYFLVRLRKFKSACALPDPRRNQIFSRDYFKIISQRKHPFLLALRRLGRFARRKRPRRRRATRNGCFRRLQDNCLEKDVLYPDFLQTWHIN